MADAEVSALVELLATEINVSADWIPVVDVSEGDAGSKKIHPSEFMAAVAANIPAGSVSAPAIAFTDDTDTGLYLGAVGELCAAVGGVKRLTIQSSGIVTPCPSITEPTYGLELLTNNAFTGSADNWTLGAGWAYSSNTALHTAGNTATLVGAFSGLTNAHYRVVVTITGRTAGSVTASFTSGGQTHSAKTATFTGTIRSIATGANNLIITPTTDFDGAIDSVSVMVINQSIVSGINIANSDGTAGGMQLKAGGSGLNNIFMGTGVGSQNISGSYCVGIGHNALYLNTQGNNNVGIGSFALQANTDGYSNVAIGYYALNAAVTSVYNVAIGYESMKSSLNGGYNVAIGFASLQSTMNGGTGNTALGTNAGRNVSSGTFNVCVGYSAGQYYGSGTNVLATPTKSIYIGYQARGAADTDDNAIVIGYNVVGLGLNTTVLGNTATTLALVYGAHRLATVAAPSDVADHCHIYSADQAAGNACPHVRTENGATLKLFQGAAVADATGAGDVVAQLNFLLARLRAHGLIAT